MADTRPRSEKAPAPEIDLYGQTIMGGLIFGALAGAFALRFLSPTLLPHADVTLDELLWHGVLENVQDQGISWSAAAAAGMDWRLLLFPLVACPVGALCVAIKMRQSVVWSVLVATIVGPIVGAALILLWRSGFANNPHAAVLLYGTAKVVVGPAVIGWLAGFAACWLVPGDGRTSWSLLRGANVDKRVRRGAGKRDVVPKAKAKGAIALAGQIVPQGVETKHTALIGTTGTGKSTVTATIIETARARGDRMVIADPGGEAMRRFWREGDVILNPFDARSAKWDLFAEIEEPTDYDLIAAVLLPMTGSADANEWVEEARLLLSALMQAFHRLDGGGTDEFARMLKLDRQLWPELVAGTEAAFLYEEGNERMRSSVVNKLKPAVKVLSAIAEADGEPFSIRRWMRQEAGQRQGGGNAGAGSGTGACLWMPYRLNQLTTLRRVIGSWTGLAILEASDLEPDPDRRVWFVLDELDVLGPVENLKLGLTNSRKFGGCFVLGLQSIAQLADTYGENQARTIIENCSTKLILRCEVSRDGGTAEYASTLIGDREVAYEDRTQSEERDAKPSVSMKQRTERAVLASEVTQLPDRTGFLRLGGAEGWRKVAFPFVEFATVAKAHEPVRIAAKGTVGNATGSRANDNDGGTNDRDDGNDRRAPFVDAAE